MRKINVRKRTAAVVVVGLVALATVVQAQQTPSQIISEIQTLLEQLKTTLPTEPPACTYTVSPTAPPAVSASGGAVTFNVSAGTACAWTIASSNDWAVPSQTDGLGSAAVTVTVAPNTAAAQRSTLLTIAGKSVTLNQQAAAPPTSDIVTTPAQFTAALLAKQPLIKVQAALTGNWTIDYGPVSIECPTTVAAGIRPKPQGAVGQFIAADRFKPPLQIDRNGRANHVTIRGCLFTGVAPDRALFIAGDDGETDVAKLPTNLTLDRNDFLGVDGLGHRAVELHAAGVVFTNNHVSGFLERYRQSQGFLSTNGPGPFLIENNYIEASGENILIGGNDPGVKDLIPSDIIIRNNLLYKPLDQYPPNSVVNNLELKNARRVLIEGNTLDGSRVDVQTGQALVLTPRNQYGKCTWCTVEDVIVRRNTFQNYAGYATQILCTDNNFPSGRTTNITFEGNLFRGKSIITFTSGMDGDFRFVNNTFPDTTNAILTFNGTVPPAGEGARCRPNLTVEKNVGRTGRFGVNSQAGGGQGSPSLTSYTTLKRFAENVLEQGNGTTFYWQRLPSGNTYLNTPGQLAPLLDEKFIYKPGGAGWSGMP